MRLFFIDVLFSARLVFEWIWRVFVDTFVMILTSTIAGLIHEVGILKMTWEQSSYIRLTAAIVTVLTIWSYGLCKKWGYRLIKAQEGDKLKKGIINTLSFVIFHLFSYAIILKVFGATARQIISACGTVTVCSLFFGEIYARFLNWVEKRIGVKSNGQ